MPKRIMVNKRCTGDGVRVLSGVDGASAEVGLEDVLGVVGGEELGGHDYKVWVLKRGTGRGTMEECS